MGARHDRIDFVGLVGQAQDMAELLPALRDGGYRAVAICLLNAYADPVHEKRLAALIGEAHAMAMRAVSLDGADSSAHQALGVVLSMLGQSEQAMAEERRALEDVSELPDVAGPVVGLELAHHRERDLATQRRAKNARCQRACVLGG